MSDNLTHSLTQHPAQSAMHTLDIDPCWRTIGTSGDRTCTKLQEFLRCVNCTVYHDKAQMLLERLPAHIDTEQDDTPVTPGDACKRFNVLAFRLEGEWLAMPTRMLDEVGELRSVHPVPHRRRGALLGLANVRGALTPCVSLARLLSLPADTSDRTGLENRGRMLIVKDGARQIAIPVDAVEGIHAIEPNDITAAPATLAGGAQSVASGIVNCGKYRAGLIDPVSLQQALAGVLA